jgi:hypothetical protein
MHDDYCQAGRLFFSAYYDGRNYDVMTNDNSFLLSPATDDLMIII